MKFKMDKKIRKVGLTALTIGLLAVLVVAAGTISGVNTITGTGDIEIQPAGGQLKLTSSAPANFQLYLKNTAATGVSGVRFEDENGVYKGYLGYNNDEDKTTFYSTGSLYLEGAAPTYMEFGANNRGLILKGQSEAITGSTYVYIKPGGNATRTIGFSGNSNYDAIGGLRFYADQTGDKLIIPYADNQYDLGSSTYAWKNIYYEGSLTDTAPDAIETEMDITGKKALDYEVVRSGITLDITKAPTAVYSKKDIPLYETINNQTIQTGLEKDKVVLDVGEGVVWSHLQITELKQEIAQLKQRIAALETGGVTPK
jgi:predicted small secreted protein